MSFYVIVRGPLGAGKTTVARALARALRGEALGIDPILERWEWDGGSESLFLGANRVAAERALSILKVGVPVVLDGNFYWRSAIEDLRERLPFPHAVFTLKVPLEVCVERDQHRQLSYGEEGVREVFEKVSRFAYGTPIDGMLPVPEQVREIERQLRLRGLVARRGGEGTRATP